MLRDNKFNEALLQSDTGRQSRNKKATKDSLDLPAAISFQRNRGGQRDFAPRYTMEMLSLKRIPLSFLS